MSADQSFFGFLLERPEKAPEPQPSGIVWVDELQDYPAEMVSTRAKSHGTRWCHMWANDAASVDELHRIAKACGLKRVYFQNRPGFPHYDLVPSKRALALAAGAREKSLREWIAERRAGEARAASPKPQARTKPVKRGPIPMQRVPRPITSLNPPRHIPADVRTYRLRITTDITDALR